MAVCVQSAVLMYDRLTADSQYVEQRRFAHKIRLQVAVSCYAEQSGIFAATLCFVIIPIDFYCVIHV